MSSSPPLVRPLLDSRPPSLSASSSYSHSSAESIFPHDVWGRRNSLPLPARVPEREMHSKMADRLRAVAEMELPPALPESPEVIMRAHRPLPAVPAAGTRPGPALGLALGQPSQLMAIPSGLPTPPPTESPKSWTQHVDSPKSWTTHSVHSDSPRSSTHDVPKPIHAQPLPALPPTLPATRPRSLGRMLPQTLTESLELLVRVQEHCHKLGGPTLNAVPEESFPLTPSPRSRRGSHPGPPPLGVRRATEPALSCTNLHAVPEGQPVRMPPRPPRRVTAPAPLQRQRSASSSSSSSGDWPETPRTSVYAGPTSAAESVPVFATMQEDRRRSRPAMRSVVALDSAPISPATLNYAAELELQDEAGRPLRFSDLLTSPRTLVIFVRHWLSPSCAAYLRELIAALTPALLARAQARVVCIGHGAASMIRGFRQHLQCPFAVYTDPSRRLHDVMGLVPKGSKKGFHLRGAKDLFMGAARMGLRSGNKSQMGGLFVFDGHDVAFAHRMRGDDDHAPLPQVLEAVSRPHPPVARARTLRSHRNSVYISRPGCPQQPRGAYSCTALVDPPPRLVFPLPPGAHKRKESRKRLTSASRDCVAVVHPDDIDRITGEVRALRT